jgi:glutamyl-Q tRNA(Asp) synthetase
VSGARSSSAIATTSTAEPRPYCGRFAPSPTGALHFGSLVAALGSFLEARTRSGRWLVRIEDLDPPREVAGSAREILQSLDVLGLEWDGTIVRQSERRDLYEAALDRLRAAGATRHCSCTRSALTTLPENRQRAPGDELFHPAACVVTADGGHVAAALRFRVPEEMSEFEDRSLGWRTACVAREVGDFVLKRRDGLYAYQLAVVVDDFEQGVTDVVRGADLLSSTARQKLLQRALGLSAVTYLHLPLAVAADGTKLSKSGAAPAIATAPPGLQLWLALDFLGQGPPTALRLATAGEVLQWGLANWRPGRFAGIMARAASGGPGNETRLQEETR